MPWESLAKLRKLKVLDVVGSPFDDDHLAHVLQHIKLRGMRTYYTKLTPASWPTVLSNSSLRGVWVSTEMLEGALPENMPDTTSIREVVTMNVGFKHLDYLKELLKPYPNVKTFNM